ncbi:MAG: Fur family transcriptional regulator [Actinomycetota bacterium]|nr:transcriptional repressor [Actinomycetota bacterium]
MTTPSNRSTKQRTAVLEALESGATFLSAQQLFDKLRVDGRRIGLTTVYRALQAMTDSGLVDVVLTRDGESTYRRCSGTHHHHLVCRSCGDAVEVASADFEEWSLRVAGEHGFTEVTHEVEIFGTCARCSGGLPKRARRSGRSQA